MTFFLCQPSEVTAGQGCVSGGTQVGAAQPLSGGQATSAATTNTSASGTYCWRAVYSGSEVYAPSTHTNAGSECFTTAAFKLEHSEVPQVFQGQRATSIITVKRESGSAQSVSFTAENVPGDTQATFDPEQCTPNPDTDECSTKLSITGCISKDHPSEITVVGTVAGTPPLKKTTEVPIPQSVPNQLVPLAAAILPASRSVETTPPSSIPSMFDIASAFTVIVNGEPETELSACGVSIRLADSQDGPLPPISFTYSQTDPETNTVLPCTKPKPEDCLNQPVDIPAGTMKTFVIGLWSEQPLGPQDLKFTFAGDNATVVGGNPPGPPPIGGVNTLLTSISSGSVPDLIAIAATNTGDGIVHVPGPQGIHAFGVAAVNAGRRGDMITVSANTRGVVLPVDLFVCQTDLTIDPSGACISPQIQVYSSVSGPITDQQGRPVGPSLQLNPGASATFAISIKATGTVCPYFAFNRVFVSFTDSANVIRGLTSVAVTTESDPLSRSCGGP